MVTCVVSTEVLEGVSVVLVGVSWSDEAVMKVQQRLT